MSKSRTLFGQPNAAKTPAGVQFDAKVFRDRCLSQKESVTLAQSLLSKEGDIIAQNRDHTDDGGTGMGETSLNAKFRAYNMFEWDDPECSQIRMAIKYAIAEMYPDFKENLYGRMWGSILRRGQALKPHQHNFDEYSFLSAQIVLQSEKTSTFYQNPFGLDAQGFEDEAGMLTIFPEYLLHWTDQHKNSIVPRIALGVDILTESALDDEQKQKLVEM